MPSKRNHPPAKTVEVTLTRGCHAAGAKHPAGETVTVSPSEANLLIGSGLAFRGRPAAPVAKKAPPKKKAAAPAE